MQLKTGKFYLVCFMLCLFIFSGCINDKSRKNHKWTVKICDTLYSETFSTFSQGAWGGDRDGRWLTDSTNFRIFLGAFDETSGGIFIECKTDSVFVTQLHDGLDVNENIKDSVVHIYQLNDLRKLNNLDDF